MNSMKPGKIISVLTMNLVMLHLHIWLDEKFQEDECDGDGFNEARKNIISVETKSEEDRSDRDGFNEVRKNIISVKKEPDDITIS